MRFIPVIAAHLSVDLVQLFTENVSENQVKASFSRQQAVFPARGNLVETPIMTTWLQGRTHGRQIETTAASRNRGCVRSPHPCCPEPRISSGPCRWTWSPELASWCGADGRPCKYGGSCWMEAAASQKEMADCRMAHVTQPTCFSVRDYSTTCRWCGTFGRGRVSSAAGHGHPRSGAAGEKQPAGSPASQWQGPGSDGRITGRWNGIRGKCRQFTCTETPAGPLVPAAL